MVATAKGLLGENARKRRLLLSAEIADLFQQERRCRANRPGRRTNVRRLITRDLDKSAAPPRRSPVDRSRKKRPPAAQFAQECYRCFCRGGRRDVREPSLSRRPGVVVEQRSDSRDLFPAAAPEGQPKPDVLNESGEGHSSQDRPDGGMGQQRSTGQKAGSEKELRAERHSAVHEALQHSSAHSSKVAAAGMLWAVRRVSRSHDGRSKCRSGARRGKWRRDRRPECQCGRF